MYVNNYFIYHWLRFFPTYFPYDEISNFERRRRSIICFSGPDLWPNRIFSIRRRLNDFFQFLGQAKSFLKDVRTNPFRQNTSERFVVKKK